MRGSAFSGASLMLRIWEPVGTGEVAIGVQPFEVELDRPLRQDLGPAGGDEGGHDRVEPVAARVAAATTRSQVNMTIRRIR